MRQRLPLALVPWISACRFAYPQPKNGPPWANPRRNDREQAARHVVLARSAATSAIPYATTVIDWVCRVRRRETPRNRAWPHRKQTRMERILDLGSSGNGRIDLVPNAGRRRRGVRVTSLRASGVARRSWVVLMKTTPSRHGSNGWR